jgi:hypothetical protein
MTSKVAKTAYIDLFRVLPGASRRVYFEIPRVKRAFLPEKVQKGSFWAIWTLLSSPRGPRGPRDPWDLETLLNFGSKKGYFGKSSMLPFRPKSQKLPFLGDIKGNSWIITFPIIHQQKSISPLLPDKEVGLVSTF